MIECTCPCGAALEANESELNAVANCASCGATSRYVCAESLKPGEAAGDFDLALVVEAGPQHVGEQLVLGGVVPIEIGKLDGKSIQLAGTKVSRNHCKLTRIDAGPSRWELTDTGSTNGTFVNRQKIASRELKVGDQVTIGEYSLLVRDSSLVPVTASVPEVALAAAAAPPARVPSPPAFRPSNAAYAQTKTCPKCNATLPVIATFCVTCGRDLITGKRQVISKDVDEDAVQANADSVAMLLSWIIPIGLFPIASEALGGKKPLTTWILTALTAVCSIAFMFAMRGPEEPSVGLQNLMLWSGDPVKMSRAEQLMVEQELTEAVRFENPKLTTQEARAEVARQLEEAKKETREAVANGELPGFRWYQLLTHAFLHDVSSWIGLIFHFGGNTLFLLVFGLRVNELIGQWRFAVSYVVLAIAAGLAHHIAESGESMMPMLGASGAIMGLAGMYFVLFPRQKVFMVFWLRLGPLAGFKRITAVWKMPGFWLLAALIAWSDVLPVIFSRVLGGDGVAHFAHLGGFVAGATLAIVWLMTKQVHAHGSDLISSVLGPKKVAPVSQG